MQDLHIDCKSPLGVCGKCDTSFDGNLPGVERVNPRVPGHFAFNKCEENVGTLGEYEKRAMP